MPCYDKKLEAVRPEFAFGSEESKTQVKEIDTVLATHELLDLFELKQIRLDQV
jgi:iron only hydrogenase large subunit-like protein